METPIQLDFAETTIKETLEWAKKMNIHLVKIEPVVPFVLTDKEMYLWLFMDTDDRITEYEQSGTIEQIKKHISENLAEHGYQNDYLEKVFFRIDSHQNVVENYEGSYFYRLR
ncbi:MAG: hypothetical protein ABJ004_00970 [Cyclobacteriaceae bacterium]